MSSGFPEFEKRYQLHFIFWECEIIDISRLSDNGNYRIICMRCDFPRSINIGIDSIGKLEGRKECRESKKRPRASLYMYTINNRRIIKRFSYFLLDAIFKYKFKIIVYTVYI